MMLKVTYFFHSVFPEKRFQSGLSKLDGSQRLLCRKDPLGGTEEHAAYQATLLYSRFIWNSSTKEIPLLLLFSWYLLVSPVNTKEIAAVCHLSSLNLFVHKTCRIQNSTLLYTYKYK